MRAVERLRAAWHDGRDTIARYSAATAGLRRATMPVTLEDELRQYRPWVHPDGSSIVPLEELIAPPASAKVLIVTASPSRYRYVVARAGLNPGQAVHVRHPWQVDGMERVRVIVLSDAYQLPRWIDLQDALAFMRGGLFLLLPA